jgi:hypothetical protein
MNKFSFVIAFLFLSAAAVSSADQIQQVITLKDGSQIKGDLSGVENGVYTIKTPMIGDVASITNGGVPAAALPPADASNPSMDQQIAAGQEQLMSNPQSMAMIQEIAQDPEIMKALSDPSLVQAVTSHNYQAVQSNPEFQALMNTPKMQALLQKLSVQQQQQNTSS